MGFAVAARRRGLGVLYLGADVPVASWVKASDATRVPSPSSVPSATPTPPPRSTWSTPCSRHRTIRALRSEGGPRAGIADSAGVVVLPEPLDAAVEIVHRLLRAGS